MVSREGVKQLSLKILMTQGVREIGCSDWDLAISLITNHFYGNEDFISFKTVDGKTVVTNGNDGHLLTIDNKQLFSEAVWAIYGDDGEIQYYTIMLPSEY